jgi:hypothetical protein
MQTVNDSSQQRDSDTPIALYFFLGILGLSVLSLVLYVLFGS